MRSSFCLPKAILAAILPALAVRWTWPLVVSLVSGGVVDTTTLLFASPLVFATASYPGYLAAIDVFILCGGTPRATGTWVRASLVLQLTAMLASLVLWALHAAPILSTLDLEPILQFTIPPIAGAGVCVWLRLRIRDRERAACALPA